MLLLLLVLLDLGVSAGTAQRKDLASSVLTAFVRATLDGPIARRLPSLDLSAEDKALCSEDSREGQCACVCRVEGQLAKVAVDPPQDR